MSQPAFHSTAANPPKTDEFFIGWLPTPPGYARRCLIVAIGVVVLAAAVAAVVAAQQHHPGPGRWDTDAVVQVDGYLFTRPYPMLRVPASGGQASRTILLVEKGKFGARSRAESLGAHVDGLPVRASGTMLRRDGRMMLELGAGAAGLRPLKTEESHALAPVLTRKLAAAEAFHLRGEVIDPKCYFGAMRPGGGKTHKACAMLCISGGIPPMLVVRDREGAEDFYLLAKENGGPANELVLPFVGDMVEVMGQLEVVDDLRILRLDAATLRRSGPNHMRP